MTNRVRRASDPGVETRLPYGIGRATDDRPIGSEVVGRDGHGVSGHTLVTSDAWDYSTLEIIKNYGR